MTLLVTVLTFSVLPHVPANLALYPWGYVSGAGPGRMARMAWFMRKKAT
jgi:hypothetical protein